MIGLLLDDGRGGVIDVEDAAGVAAGSRRLPADP